MKRLKPKMTFTEMADHMKENSMKMPNRVTVGKYARMMGFRVYKPVIKGVRYHFYINENVGDY